MPTLLRFRHNCVLTGVSQWLHPRRAQRRLQRAQTLALYDRLHRETLWVRF